MADLLSVVVRPLAASLAKQASRMEERKAAQGDILAALGEVLRDALSQGRAHIRDSKGGVRPVVPGLTEQDQGLTRTHTGDNWGGRGPAIYWFPERGPALGITTHNLNMLLKASGDPRVNGYMDRSLPDALIQAGAAFENTSQKGRVASHRIRVGADNLRLLLLRPSVVWDM
jgi:hypothetical protein